MLQNVFDQIVVNKQKNNKQIFVETNIENTDIDDYTNKLIIKLTRTVSESFFAKNFLRSSLERKYPSFIISSDEKDICSIHFSIMINNSMNILIGKVSEVDFIIAQHVTSCDFIYFPKYNYIYTVAHTDPKLASSVLISLTNYIKDDVNLISKIDECGSQLKGIILSHARPYHFFYDIAPMAECLYQEDLLDKFPHYQIKDGSFLDFSALYQISSKNIITDSKSMNNSCILGKDIFFKVGIAYKNFKKEYQSFINTFDKRIVRNAHNLNADKAILNTVQRFKNDNSFILWFGISTDKRSLINQDELAVSLIEKLSKYYKVSVVIDGWTAITNKEHTNLYSDIEVLNEIKKKFDNVNFISLIGATSATKIAVSTLVDFQISSGATGSIWASRFGRKEGILHSSQAFYYIQDINIHRAGLDYPNELVTDVIEEVRRVDYTSYHIDKNNFLEFIKNSYPNIFNKEIHLKRLNTKNMCNVEVIDAIQNSFKSLNNDPQLMMDIQSLKFNEIKLPYNLHLTCYIDFPQGSLQHEAKFYLDYGKGFTESQVIRCLLGQDKNCFEIDVKIEKPLYQIRFDPTDLKDIGFNFNGVFYSVSTINQ